MRTQKRTEAVKMLPRVSVCYCDTKLCRGVADWLSQLNICESSAILSVKHSDVLWACLRDDPKLLLLEITPESDADHANGIAERCELAMRIKECLPDCRVLLVCCDDCHEIEPTMRKAVELKLVDGYFFGNLDRKDIEKWLSD